MPDEGASMKDAVPRVEGEPSDAGADHGTRERVQREPMAEYEIDERERESATVIERAGGEGRDDGSDHAAPNLNRDTGDGPRD